MKYGHVKILLGISALATAVMLPASAVKTESRDVEVEFTFDPYIDVSLSDDSLIISELAPGNFKDSNTINIGISTNSVAGYTMTATVGSSTYDSRSLEYNGNEFQMVDNTAAPVASLGDSQWGFHPVTLSGGTWVADTTYAGLPLYTATGVKISDADTGPVAHTIPFTIGAKAASSQTPGTYNNIVNFQIVPNIPYTGTLNDIENMQDDNIAAACANTPTPLASDGANTPQYQLKDTRDNKLYWVAKLADGNCWMTQNLDLDISTAGLSATDTDIAADWNSSSTYKPVATVIAPFSETSSTTTDSYDGGNYYWIGHWGGSDGIPRLDYEFIPTFSTTKPVSQGDHYHVGNLYQWNAATAGTGGTVTDTEIDSSICPTGWRLPFFGDYDDYNADKSFDKLLSIYDAIDNIPKIIAAPYSSFLRVLLILG